MCVDVGGVGGIGQLSVEMKKERGGEKKNRQMQNKKVLDWSQLPGWDSVRVLNTLFLKKETFSWQATIILNRIIYQVPKQWHKNAVL